MASIEEHKAIVRRLAEEVIQGGNLDLIPALFAPDYVPHDPSNPTRRGGIEGARDFIAQLQEGVTDVRYTIEDLIAEGDKVVRRFKCSGTHLGEWLGHGPTGRRFEGIDEVYIFRIRDGRIVHA